MVALRNNFKKSIYIDALALVPDRKSGVGSTLRQTLEHLAALPELETYMIYLVVPIGKAKYLQEYLRSNIKTKTIFLPARGLEVLLRLHLMPPVDWLLGKGVYIFPNYRNWPLWRSRSLTYVYDLGYLLHPETVHVKNQKYLRRYMPTWLRRADRIIAISTQVQEEIEKYLDIPYTKIDIVYCGVETTVFHKQDQSKIQAVKSKYGVPFKRYLLYVGNIEPRKNLVALLEAYQHLQDSLKTEFGLVFVGGGGWLNEEFYGRFEESKQRGEHVLKVDSYVRDEDLPALYSGAAALVLPAIYEGFGITPLEAMACETPVIISDIASVREIVQDAGHYFDPTSSDSIKKSITETLQEEPNTLAESTHKGLMRVKELSWQNSAESLYRVIDEQIKEGPHRRPILRRLHIMYKLLERQWLILLGEGPVSTYRPKEAGNISELRTNVYDDFLREQPSRLQTVTLKLYIKTRHITGLIAKGVYRKVKRA